MVSQNPLLDYLRERRGGDHLVRLGDAHQTAALTLAKPFGILPKKIAHLYYGTLYFYLYMYCTHVNFLFAVMVNLKHVVTNTSPISHETVYYERF